MVKANESARKTVRVLAEHIVAHVETPPGLQQIASTTVRATTTEEFADHILAKLCDTHLRETPLAKLERACNRTHNRPATRAEDEETTSVDRNKTKAPTTPSPKEGAPGTESETTTAAPLVGDAWQTKNADSHANRAFNAGPSDTRLLGREGKGARNATLSENRRDRDEIAKRGRTGGNTNDLHAKATVDCPMRARPTCGKGYCDHAKRVQRNANRGESQGKATIREALARPPSAHGYCGPGTIAAETNGGGT